jgi:hypothetical protein
VRYTLKGIDDSETVCSICGRIELKRVMWLAPIDADDAASDAFPCGVVCGARLLGTTVARLETRIRNHTAGVEARRRALYYGHPASKREAECYSLLNALGLSFAERRQHPLFLEAHACREEARIWAESQPVIIEL